MHSFSPAAPSISLVGSFSSAQPFIAPLPPAPAPMPVPSGMIDWSNNTVLQLLDIGLDSELFGMTGAERVNLVVDSVLGTGGGNVSFSAPQSLPPLQLNLTSLANFSIKLLGGWVAGLDTFDAFDVLEPDDKYSLKSALSLKQMNVSLRVHAVVDSNSGGKDAETDLSINLGLQDVKLSLEALTAIKQLTLNNMHLNQFSQLGCALRMFDALNISDLGVSYSGFHYEPELASREHNLA